MKQVTILRTTFARGELLERGETPEVEDAVAAELIATKKAVEGVAKVPGAKKSPAKKSGKSGDEKGGDDKTGGGDNGDTESGKTDGATDADKPNGDTDTPLLGS